MSGETPSNTASAIIMAWSKCKIEIGTGVAAGGMPSSLSSVGKIKDKSTTLEPADGNVLEMRESGGKLVAREVQDGDLVIKTRIIEPADALYTTLGLGAADSTVSTEFNVTTHIPSSHFGVKLTPKNIGARGIKAPWCSIAFKPGFGEEDGNYVDLEITIEQGVDAYWYKRFTVASSDWA